MTEEDGRLPQGTSPGTATEGETNCQGTLGCPSRRSPGVLHRRAWPGDAKGTERHDRDGGKGASESEVTGSGHDPPRGHPGGERGR